MLLLLEFLVKLPGRTEYLFGGRGYRRQSSVEGMMVQSMVLCELQNPLRHLLCNLGRSWTGREGRVPASSTLNTQCHHTEDTQWRTVGTWKAPKPRPKHRPTHRGRERKRNQSGESVVTSKVPGEPGGQRWKQEATGEDAYPVKCFWQVNQKEWYLQGRAGPPLSEHLIPACVDSREEAHKAESKVLVVRTWASLEVLGKGH